jgi:glutamate synthase (NADPH/NADH) small chain
LGKLKGFIEIKRKSPKKRDVKSRLKDFNEIYKIMSDSEIEEQSERCMNCGVPFCHSYGCPLGNLIPEFNYLVCNKHWQDALKILTKAHPFPEITGRICPALCEASCVCGIDGEPVSIRQIELSLIEKGFSENWIQPKKIDERKTQKIAVVGSGPTGLSAAKYLNDLGYNVTVYEKNSKSGGILYYGIPDFKLPKAIVERRIKLLEQEGIVFENEVNIGEDISFNYLNKNYDAILLACGALKPRDVKIPGRNLKNIYFAMDYLTQQNKINNNEKVNDRIVAKDKIVVVIGGGDTGADCVGTANRQGAKKVYQLEIMPKPPLERGENIWPEYPMILRTSTSHEEGCVRKWNVLTKEFLGNSDNVIEKIKCVEVKWNKKNGKYTNFEEIKDSEFFIKSDLVLIAAGFISHGNQEIIENSAIEVNKRGFLKVNNNFMTNVEGVFCSGDMSTGPSLVVKAFEEGRNVAYKINEYLKNS